MLTNSNYKGEKSKCCDSDFEVVSSNEGTSFYKCRKCLNACDVISSYKNPNRKRTFEDLLKEFHANNYHGLDDDMSDSYERYLEEIDQDKMIELADMFAREMYLRGKAEVLDLINKK